MLGSLLQCMKKSKNLFFNNKKKTVRYIIIIDNPQFQDHSGKLRKRRESKTTDNPIKQIDNLIQQTEVKAIKKYSKKLTSARQHVRHREDTQEPSDTVDEWIRWFENKEVVEEEKPKEKSVKFVYGDKELLYLYSAPQLNKILFDCGMSYVDMKYMTRDSKIENIISFWDYGNFNLKSRKSGKHSPKSKKFRTVPRNSQSKWSKSLKAQEINKKRKSKKSRKVKYGRQAF